MTNSCSRQVSAMSLLIAAGLVLILWPAAGQGQRSSRRQAPQAAKPADPNAPVDLNSWASFEIVLQRNIFSRQRRPYRPAQAVEERPSPPAPNPESYYVLKGVVQENDDFIAFVEDTQGGTVLRLRRGDPVARGTIKTLTLDGLEYQMEDKTVVVRLGLDLEGGQGATATSSMMNLSATPASSTTSRPSAAPSGEESDILKRLMEQRKQQLGQ